VKYVEENLALFKENRHQVKRIRIEEIQEDSGIVFKKVVSVANYIKSRRLGADLLVLRLLFHSNIRLLP